MEFTFTIPISGGALQFVIIFGLMAAVGVWGLWREFRERRKRSKIDTPVPAESGIRTTPGATASQGDDEQREIA